MESQNVSNNAPETQNVFEITFNRSEEEEENSKHSDLPEQTAQTITSSSSSDANKNENSKNKSSFCMLI